MADKDVDFDPYHKWLGIPREARPVTLLDRGEEGIHVHMTDDPHAFIVARTARKEN